LNGTMRGVRDEGGGRLTIGAMTTLTELERSPQVAAALPAMSRALRTLSNIRVRNVATLGGHLAHGDPHMDLPPILLTLDAQVSIAGHRGRRAIGISDLFVGYYQTSLEKNELITDVEVPALTPDVYSWYEKFTGRSADDWPTVGVAVWYRVNSNVITEARIAVSAATDRPVR